jgi:(p)ppGpp synthase/HD superfamily hydrolase
MQQKHLGLNEVQDIFAFRLIVADQDDCYLALHAVHRLFEPEPFRFKDYIAAPKANGYRSLHTSVCDRNGLVFEIQIRSVDMHREAEDGEAAHWRYHAKRPVSRRA